MATADITSSTASNTSLITISQVSQLGSVWLPPVLIHGIPWKIQVCKEEGKHQLALAAYLYCGKDGLSEWSHAAVTSFELLSHDANRNSIKCHSIPYVFVSSEIENGYGNGGIMKWSKLFSENKKFVVDDSIKMKIEINVEDPNQPNKCNLKFERIDGPCDCGYAANLRLTIENVANLLVVRSRQFKMRDMSFVLMVFKDHTSHIGILLECETASENDSCRVTLKAKLVSSKADGKSAKANGTIRMRDFDELVLRDIVSWDELLEPKNGFIENGALIVDLEIRAEFLEGGTGSNARKRKATHDHKPAAKRLKLECKICKNEIIDQDISSLACGHIFCSPCIIESIKVRKVCPSCDIRVTLNGVRRIVLPTSD